MPSQLQSITLQAPGFRGINTQASATSLSPEWALLANNAVFDGSSRIAARKGFSKLTTSAIAGTPDVSQIAVFEESDGSSTVISAANNKLYSGTTTLTDITPTTGSVTADNWKFQNFNNKIIGFQDSHDAIEWDGVASDFTYIKDAGGHTGPPSGDIQGNTVLSAFGRLWASSSDGYTLVWSDLLDEHNWSTGSSGSLDTNSIFPSGGDKIVALAAYNNFLVIFGEYSIIVYDNPEVPSTIVLADTIVGVGCIERDSVQDVGTDLMFLSHSGVRSLARTIETNTLPLQDLSQQVKNDVIGAVDNIPTANKIRSIYNPVEGFYLLSLDTVQYCFDVKLSQQGVQPRATTWDSSLIKSLAYGRDEVMYIGGEGVVGKYDSYLDDTSTYLFTYKSTWLDFDSSVLKFPKRIRATVAGGYSYDFKFTWSFDFSAQVTTGTKAIVSQFTPAEWGEAEWGEDAWSGGDSEISSVAINMRKAGQHIQWGWQVIINGSPLSIQKVDLFVKLGRVAR